MALCLKITLYSTLFQIMVLLVRSLSSRLLSANKHQPDLAHESPISVNHCKSAERERTRRTACLFRPPGLGRFS